MGRAADVSRKISASLVNIWPHRCFIPVAKIEADRPIMVEMNTATKAANLALFGLFPPSSLPTRVETANPSELGKM
uniref:Uncharacterized protein n=1 Tax=Rhizophora mucronata TaxID=61149 RepID=A0A2P2NZE0_RHIMU